MSPAAKPASLGQCDGRGIRAIGLGAVELDRAGDPHGFVARAEREKAIGVLLVLHGDQVDLLDQRSHR